MSQVDYFVPSGGIDLVTPALKVANGSAIDALNFECDVNDGYSRISGYDRWDGLETVEEMSLQTAVISKIGEGYATYGNTFVGVSSGATMRFRQFQFEPSELPILGLGQTTNVGCYVSDVRGAFLAGEDLVLENDPLSFFRLIVAPANIQAANNRDLAVAQSAARADVRLAVRNPGDAPTFTNVAVGPVLGVAYFRGVTWVIREFGETPGTSFFLRQTGLKDTDGNWRGQWERDDGALFTTDGARVRFLEHNFYGDESQTRLYGVTGTQRAFVFDGETWEFITTDADTAVDKPHLVASHANRLVLAISSSIVLSSATDPTDFNALTGTAAAIACGDYVTNIYSIKGADSSGALIVTTRSGIHILYGDGPGSYVLRTLQPETGAEVGTMDSVGQPIFVSDYGVATVAAVQAYGGFNMSTISEQAKPFFASRLRKATAVVVVRKKNQYRVFFDDGFAMYITMKGNKVHGMMPIYIGKVVTCTWSSILPDGSELILIGTKDGGLYRMDVGRSFDGEPILYYLRMAFNHFKTPKTRKRFQRATIEMDNSGYTEFDFGYDIDYAGTTTGNPSLQTVTTPIYGTGDLFDSGTYDESRFDDAVQRPAIIGMEGRGENVGLHMHAQNNYVDPYRVTGVLIQYMMGRQSR